MSVLDQVTPMVLTYNEEPNIERTLDGLRWAKRVVVIDSHSTDATLDIIARYDNVDLHFRKFDTFAGQCNYGLGLIETEWVLSMDADYVLPTSFVEEMESKLNQSNADAFAAEFKFCVFGRPLRADNTTARQVLYRREKAKYKDIGHQHRVQVTGDSENFKEKILHDDRKSLSRWLKSQDGYLKIEAEKLSRTPFGELDFVDKLRKLKILAPIIIFFYLLFAKGMILEGWHGWYYTFQRTLVELLLSIRLIENEKFQDNND